MSCLNFPWAGARPSMSRPGLFSLPFSPRPRFFALCSTVFQEQEVRVRYLFLSVVQICYFLPRHLNTFQLCFASLSHSQSLKQHLPAFFHRGCYFCAVQGPGRPTGFEPGTRDMATVSVPLPRDVSCMRTVGTITHPTHRDTACQPSVSPRHSPGLSSGTPSPQPLLQLGDEGLGTVWP